MHLRASQALGSQIIDDSQQTAIGMLGDPLIDPDTGHIIGFFVFSLMMGEMHLFLQTVDIVSWGTRVHVLSSDKLGPLEDFIRMRKWLSESRTFLGQPVRTKEGKKLGKLGDVQFNTRTFVIEWLFPKKLFFYRQPILLTDVLEVTEEAIWVRDPMRPAEQKIETEKNRGVLIAESMPLQTPEVL